MGIESSGRRENWRIAVARCVGAGTGMALAFLVGNLADLHNFWLGLIMIAIGAGGGAALGQVIGRRLFGPSRHTPPGRFANADPVDARDRPGV